MRRVSRSIHKGARDLVRNIAKTAAYLTSRRQRKKVEMCFAHLRRILKLDRLRLRDPCGAHDEFLLAATAQNLRKLAKLIPVTTPVPATLGSKVSTTPLEPSCRWLAFGPHADFFYTIGQKPKFTDVRAKSAFTPENGHSKSDILRIGDSRRAAKNVHFKVKRYCEQELSPDLGHLGSPCRPSA
jgi:hypothetical protein